MAGCTSHLMCQPLSRSFALQLLPHPWDVKYVVHTVQRHWSFLMMYNGSKLLTKSDWLHISMCTSSLTCRLSELSSSVRLWTNHSVQAPTLTAYASCPYELSADLVLLRSRFWWRPNLSVVIWPSLVQTVHCPSALPTISVSCNISRVMPYTESFQCLQRWVLPSAILVIVCMINALNSSPQKVRVTVDPWSDILQILKKNLSIYWT
jgi:hypothetical protein